MVWGSILAGFAGSAAGGGMGAIFGGGKRTGTGKAFVQALDMQERGFHRGIHNVNRSGQDYINAFRRFSPVFGQIESRVMSDLDDTQRTARLEQAFQARLGQQQASRGVFRSPSAALQSAFAGLQFGEQMRQQSLQNAFGFQQQFGQPLTASLFGAAMPNINGSEFALGGLQLAAGAQSAQNQAIMGGASQGFGLGYGIQQSGGLNSVLQELLASLSGGTPSSTYL